jgi:hypothetical protein
LLDWPPRYARKIAVVCYRRLGAVLAASPQSSGRGVEPRRSSGTLQLSTRCSSVALPPSRSLPVRVDPAWSLPRFTGRGLLGCGDLRKGQLRRNHRQDKK